MPALRIGDEEIAEDLDARHRFELFRIDEESIERERFVVAEQLHQSAVFFHQIIRQRRYAQTALRRAQHAEHVVRGQMRRARFPAVAARNLGLHRVPLLCSREVPVPGSLPQVIRVLIHYYAPEDHEPRHVYLGRAQALRADLDSAQ